MEQNEDERSAGEQQLDKQDDKEAADHLEEFKKSWEAKMALRQSNLNPERPDAGFLRTLDSSIKRNTAVIKKLKQITEEQREGLVDELRGVNLSKFVSEAVSSICEARLKSSDIQAAVQDLETDRNSKALKRRSILKLLMELYFVGVVEDCSIFVNIIKDLTSVDHLKDRDSAQTNLSLLSTFGRQGRVFLGLTLSGPEANEEVSLKPMSACYWLIAT